LRETKEELGFECPVLHKDMNGGKPISLDYVNNHKIFIGYTPHIDITKFKENSEMRAVILVKIVDVVKLAQVTKKYFDDTGVYMDSERLKKYPTLFKIFGYPLRWCACLSLIHLHEYSYI